MEQTIAALITKLDPNSIILVLVLYGVYTVAKSAMAKFSEHGTKVTDSLGKISEDCHELRKDMSIIAEKVNNHDNRIIRLENK